MKRLLSLALTLSLALALTGCGNVFVSGALPPANSSIKGTVSSIQLGTVSGNDGGFVQVTFVTFFFDGASSTINFCGDQSTQFPLNQMVTTNFTQGQFCATLIVVIVI